MELDLTAAALVNAGGGFIFLLIGAALLAIARGERMGLLVGLAAGTFGATYVVENLVRYADDPGGALLVAACAFPAIVAQLALAHHLARDLPRRVRLLLAAHAVALALAYATLSAALARPELLAPLTFDVSAQGALGAFALNGQQSSLPILVAAVGARFACTDPERHHERAALAGLGLAFGLFTAWLFTGIAPAFWIPGEGFAVATLNAGIVATSLLMAPALSPFAVGRSRSRGLARAAFPLLLGASGLGLALLVGGALRGSGFGTFGIVRTIGASILAYSIVRHHLLGVELPHLAAKRGSVAAGALATLFIVAQVAQNFFSSEYGLLTGGVVAGAFLFAAQPLQRAMERLQAPAPGVTAGPVRPAGGDENERVYKVALRRFHADGAVSAEEEVALAHLADQLGLTSRRATELRLEVARERGAR